MSSESLASLRPSLHLSLSWCRGQRAKASRRNGPGNTKPAAVVRVRRIVALPVCTAQGDRTAVPRAATNHPVRTASRTHRIGVGRRVKITHPPVIAPFPKVTRHIRETQCRWRIRIAPHRGSPTYAVVSNPMVPEVSTAAIWALVPPRIDSLIIILRCILPFRICRQTVATGTIRIASVA